MRGGIFGTDVPICWPKGTHTCEEVGFIAKSQRIFLQCIFEFKKYLHVDRTYVQNLKLKHMYLWHVLKRPKKYVICASNLRNIT
jgi:hypothetical protein